MTWRGGAKKGGARVVRAKKAESTGAEGRERQKDKRTAVKGGRGGGREGRGRGASGKREKARNVWRFGVMRFNYKTRRVLQLARRRTPHSRPFLRYGCPTPLRASRTLSFPPFRGYLRFDSPYLPSHPQLHRPFSRIPRLGPYPENYLSSPPPFRPVKDSRIARPRTPASRLLLTVAISGRGSIFYQSKTRRSLSFFSSCKMKFMDNLDLSKYLR